jgi:hypothetical protein
MMLSEIIIEWVNRAMVKVILIIQVGDLLTKVSLSLTVAIFMKSYYLQEILETPIFLSMGILIGARSSVVG